MTTVDQPVDVLLARRQHRPAATDPAGRRAGASWRCTRASPSAPATCATSRRTRGSRSATCSGSSTSTTATGRRSWCWSATGSSRSAATSGSGPAAPEAEVAFVVEDAHQGRGIGSVLLEHLADAARRTGISRFVAEVLPANGGDAAGLRRLRLPGPAPVRRRRGAPELPDRPDRAVAGGAARPGAPHRGPVHRPAARPARRRRLRRQRHRAGRRRGGARAPARRRFHRARSCRCTRARARSAGLPAYPSAADAGVAVDLAVVAVPAEAVAGGGGRRGRGRRARPGGHLRRLRRGRRRRARPAQRGAGPRGARRGHAGRRPELPGRGQHRPGGTPQRHPRPRAAGRPAGSASSASPARSGWRCWPRRTGAGWACPASSRPATGPTSPATTCCSTGRTTRAPT